MHDFILSQRFKPEYGGSITWLTEVYTRWPNPIDIFTHSYPSKGKELIIQQDKALKKQASARINSIKREDILMSDWGLDSVDSLKKYWRMNRAVRAALNHHQRLCVHCTHAVPEVASMLPLNKSKRSQLKIVCYAHGEEILACRSSKQLLKLMNQSYQASDIIICNSRNTQNMVLEHCGTTATTVIHPGIDLASFSKAKKEGFLWRKKHGYKPTDFIVMTLGRICKRKNQLGVLRAIAQICKTDSNVHYVVAGKGQEERALREEVKSLNLDKNFKLVWPVDETDKAALYGGCDIFAMPAIELETDLEGFGITFIEAGACGKLSIAGNIGGQAEAVLDQQTGVVLNGESTEEIAAAILSLKENEPFRNKLELGARARAESLDWKKVVDTTVAAVYAS